MNTLQNIRELYKIKNILLFEFSNNTASIIYNFFTTN